MCRTAGTGTDLRTTIHRWCIAAIALAAHLGSTEAGAQTWKTEGELKDYLLGIDATQDQQLQRLSDLGLMKFKPAVLPFGKDLFGVNWSLHHPVAAGDGENIVLTFARSPWHDPSAPSDRTTDSFTSNHVMIRSIDGGNTWSNQVDLRQSFSVPNPTRIAGLHALRYMGGRKYLYISGAGAMITNNFGTSWQHYPTAFGSALPTGVGGANFGPSIVEHPDFGLVAAAHAWGTNGQILNETWFWTSTTGGQSWELNRIPATSPLKNVEPTMVMLGDQLAVVARSHDASSFELATSTYRYSQGVTAPNSFQLDTQFTNIRTSDARDALAGPLAEQGYSPSKAAAFGVFSQDTVDLILNPITKRVEAIVTNRTGRAAEDTDDLSRQSLSLWSIDPEALLAGSNQWRYEATLLERHMLDAPLFVDGMHPAGSVVDLENEVQHIFIYAGYYKGPAGIFQITRTLHTDRLVAAIVDGVSLHGDYNGDGTINAADYVVWRDALSADTPLLNDPTPGSVDQSDYEYWRAHFGEALDSSSAALVPESSTLALVNLAAALCLIQRRFSCVPYAVDSSQTF
jgi:hypothetical protein